MAGPGEYVPDETEGMTRVEDLPEAKIKRVSRSYKKRRCPHCGYSAYRDKALGGGNRRFAPLPGTPRRGLRRRSPSDLRVPRAQGDQPIDPQGRRLGAQGTEAATAETPSRTALVPGRQESGAQKETTPGKDRGPVRVPLSLRQTLFPRLRTLRSIADEVYRLFDRRCRTDTALEKLAGLRRRVRRFKTPLSSSASRDRAMISIPRARNRSSHATRSATPSKQGAHHVAQKSTSTTFPCRPAIRAFSFARSIVRRASSCGLVWRPSGPCAGVVAAHPQRPAAASVTSVPVAFHRNAERSLNVAAPPPATSPGPCGT